MHTGSFPARHQESAEPWPYPWYPGTGENPDRPPAVPVAAATSSGRKADNSCRAQVNLMIQAQVLVSFMVDRNTVYQASSLHSGIMGKLLRQRGSATL